MRFPIPRLSHSKPQTEGICLHIAVGKHGEEDSVRQFVLLPEHMRDCLLPICDEAPTLVWEAYKRLCEKPEEFSSDGTKLVALVVATCDGQPSVRIALFEHRDDPLTGYVGWYDSKGDCEAIAKVFEAIEHIATKHGFSRLVGPVDGSIWSRYRYKTEGFGKTPYTGEPMNPISYPHEWQDAGFTPSHVWHSYEIPHQDATMPDKMYRRLARARDLGYEFSHMSCRNFKDELGEIHQLVSRLYSSFPGYTDIEVHAFQKKLMPARFVMDMRATILARHEGQLVGFLVAVPDYASVNPEKLLPSIRKAEMRVKPSRYVILYAGVDSGHEGLGAAMMALLWERANEVGAGAVAALIHEGKTSGAYIHMLGGKRTQTYVLYEKRLPTVNDNGIDTNASLEAVAHGSNSEQPVGEHMHGERDCEIGQVLAETEMGNETNDETYSD